MRKNLAARKYLRLQYIKWQIVYIYDSSWALIAVVTLTVNIVLGVVGVEFGRSRV